MVYMFEISTASATGVWLLFGGGTYSGAVFNQVNTVTFNMTGDQVARISQFFLFIF